ncbi:hypothetical protein C8Q76DRAFT_227875 [Earliella scabrosa]|nr:hypothetical protein C8Q76DRAFT_227875 [Earliella scabrosa]
MPTQSVSKATPIRRSATQAAFLVLLPDRPCQSLRTRGGSIEVCKVVAAPVHLSDLGQWVAGARGQALLRPHAGPRSSPSPMRRVCAQRMRRAFPSSKCFTCDSIASMSLASVSRKTHVFCLSQLGWRPTKAARLLFAGCIATFVLCSPLYHHLRVRSSGINTRRCPQGAHPFPSGHHRDIAVRDAHTTRRRSLPRRPEPLLLLDVTACQSISSTHASATTLIHILHTRLAPHIHAHS